ncbi:hypothetical protein BV25DRAFT_424207 [Artomyces pyxidatus]|uniref:Uncharacterized protein n=1 Tax=Artomyces pyxidatus TaxID=48021 RepID=A0ACB8T3G7_9AGAM|nr:hypothetical protein BV25DRAFT_424207 [Artomyces pyxidatus]
MQECGSVEFLNTLHRVHLPLGTSWNLLGTAERMLGHLSVVTCGTPLCTLTPAHFDLPILALAASQLDERLAGALLRLNLPRGPCAVQAQYCSPPSHIRPLIFPPRMGRIASPCRFPLGTAWLT